jgi:hypothetical protein
MLRKTISQIIGQRKINKKHEKENKVTEKLPKAHRHRR